MRSKDIAELKETIYDLQKYEGVSVIPILLKSPNTQFKNLLNPRILLSDFLSIFKSFLYIKPDIVVCFYVMHAYPLVILKKIFGFSLYSYAIGDDIHVGKNILYKITRKLIYINSDMVFAVAEDLKKKIQNVHDCNVIVIPFGTDSNLFKPLQEKLALRQKWGVNPKDFVIFTASRLVRGKGVKLLVKSLTTIKNDTIKLMIAGVGEELNSLKSLAMQLNVHQRTSFLGWRTKLELLELFNIADLFILPTYSEGLPRVLLEAMACGCICIATEVGDISNVIVDGYSGFLIPPGNLEKLTEKINYVASLSEEEINFIKLKARLTIIRNFDNKNLVIRMIKCFLCLAQERSSIS